MNRCIEVSKKKKNNSKDLPKILILFKILLLIRELTASQILNKDGFVLIRVN